MRTKLARLGAAELAEELGTDADATERVFRLLVSVDLFERDAEGRVSSARSAPDNFRNLGVADQRSRFASVAIGDERRTMLIGVATAPYDLTRANIFLSLAL
jgi:hypothetical protein